MIFDAFEQFLTQFASKLGVSVSTAETLLVIAILWTIPWKGISLWRASKRNEKWWFVALLLVNTLAILEILYLFVFSQPRRVESSGAPGK